MFTKSSHNNTPILSMILIFVIDMILIFTTHTSWNSAMSKYLPLKSEIQLLKSDLATGHLWLEEFLTGDRFVDLQKDIHAKFDNKRFHQYLLNSKTELSSKEDINYYKELVAIDKKLHYFNDLSILRLQNKDKHKTGSLLDQRFDKDFKDITLLINKLNNEIDNRLAKEFEYRNQYFVIVMILFLFINGTAFVLLYINRRKRVQYEYELFEEKKRAEITLYSIGDAVITTDEKGYILFLNPIAQHLTGYSLEEAQGLYLDIVFDIFNEKTKKRVETPVKRVLREGIIVGLGNHTALRSRNGEIFSIEDSAAPIKMEDGKIIGTVLVFHDVTKENQLKNRLSENEKLLIQQSKMAAMGEMLENIAHQWRQPLSMITTAASGMRIEHELNILEDDMLVKFLDSIEDSSKFLSKTIDDFRDFFKPNNEMILFNIKMIMSNALSVLNSKLEYENIEIVQDIESIEIEGFSTELLQIFLNIFNNSIDAFYNINKKNRLIFINIYQKEDRVFIKIKDNANGVDEEIIHRIFEPYFSTKHKSQGRGIGLFMVREIITKHMNGRISICNKEFIYKEVEQKGTEIEIELFLTP